MSRLYRVISRRSEGEELVFCTCHGSIAGLVQLAHGGAQETAWACADGFVRVWVVEADKEEGDIVLPGCSTVTAQVYLCYQILVSVLFIAYREFSKVGQVVHIPAKYHTAKAEAIFDDGEELLLRDQLAAKDSWAS